jgi:hypothetical protein
MLRRTAVTDAVDVATAVRTLIAGGFRIDDARRLPEHIEILCSRRDMLSAEIKYALALFDSKPSAAAISNARASAARIGRISIVVSFESEGNDLSWSEFVHILGGAVPSWRALSAEYPSVLAQAAINRLPAGYEGEPWLLFEDAVSDGIEFLFGRRVLRQGGRKRGKAVSDILALTPDHRVLVLDTKASESPFDANWSALRPLVEYTRAQVSRQRSESPVGSAVLVAKTFKQGGVALMETSAQFNAETNVALAFLESDVLTRAVMALAAKPRLRTSLRWARILCRPGLVTGKLIETEIEDTESQQLSRR